MIHRPVALWCLVLLCIAAPAAAEQTSFIDAMTRTLAVDPAQAQVQADGQIAASRSATTTVGKVRLAEAYWVKAQANFRLGDQASAREALDQARAAMPSGTAGRRILGHIDLLEGLLARNEGNYSRALQMLRAAQQAFIAARDTRGHALALQSMGVLYNDVGDGQNAVRMFSLAQETYPSPDDIFALSLCNNLGIAYHTAGQYAEARDWLGRALTIATRLQMTSVAGSIRINLARAAVAAGDLRAAEAAMAPLEPVSRLNNGNQRRDARALLALIALGEGRLEAARHLIDQAGEGLDPATSEGPLARIVHYTAYDILRAQGQDAAALVQLEAVRRIDINAAELVTSNRAALLSAQFQFAAQNTRIAELKARDLERAVGFQRALTIVVTLAGLITLGLLGSLLVTALRSRNRARRDRAALTVSHNRLERALAAKTEFLASTSHELRTPLNGILGMTQIMLADSRVTPAMRSQIELVHDAGSTMRALVDDILDVAKIEHGGFTIHARPTDVAALIERVVGLFRDPAREEGLDLRVLVDLPDEQALVDAARLTQILFNLVGNAIKFTHQGRIEISAILAGGSPPLPQRLLLSVRDSGIGIDPASHEAVFEMFHQVDATRTRSHGGTGLGLAICRQLARAMGGDIRLESALGEGSRFLVDLPWQGCGAAAPLQMAAADQVQMDVAVIAKDPMRAAMLSAIARRAGLSAHIVDTEEAIVSISHQDRLTLLVDSAAWAFAARHLAGAEGISGRTIIVGEESEEGQAGPGEEQGVTRVPFARARLEAALRSISSPLTPLADSNLQSEATEVMASRKRGIKKQKLSSVVGLK